MITPIPGSGGAPRQRVAGIIDGCFWHGCPEHGRQTFIQNAAGYGPKKTSGNVAATQTLATGP